MRYDPRENGELNYNYDWTKRILKFIFQAMIYSEVFWFCTELK